MPPGFFLLEVSRAAQVTLPGSPGGGTAALEQDRPWRIHLDEKGGHRINQTMKRTVSQRKPTSCVCTEALVVHGSLLVQEHWSSCPDCNGLLTCPWAADLECHARWPNPLTWSDQGELGVLWLDEEKETVWLPSSSSISNADLSSGLWVSVQMPASGVYLAQTVLSFRVSSPVYPSTVSSSPPPYVRTACVVQGWVAEGMDPCVPGEAGRGAGERGCWEGVQELLGVVSRRGFGTAPWNAQPPQGQGCVTESEANAYLWFTLSLMLNTVLSTQHSWERQAD